jgi:hypothetical protein
MKEGNMFKRTIQIFVGIALVMQLAGCFYHDNRWHHDHDRNYGHPEHGPDVNVNIHG